VDITVELGSSDHDLLIEAELVCFLEGNVLVAVSIECFKTVLINFLLGKAVFNQFAVHIELAVL
jgi:hypothetical protein